MKRMAGLEYSCSPLLCREMERSSILLISVIRLVSGNFDPLTCASETGEQSWWHSMSWGGFDTQRITSATCEEMWSSSHKVAEKYSHQGSHRIASCASPVKM